MTNVPVNDVSRFGIIKDTPIYKLPPAAWSVGENVRIVGSGIGTYGLGWAQVFGTPSGAPRFAMPVKDASQTWWLYMTATKAYVFGSGTHSDITRTSGGDYTSSLASAFNGTILGGIPIINNGVDVPQYWAAYSGGTPLAALPNWPATSRAKIIRALGPYLIAAHLTESGTVKPHRILTSHPAVPGSVPSSWDPTDATKDVRQFDLPDVDSGLINEMLPLKEAMYIYKGTSIHRLRPQQGRFVFLRDTVSESAGAITTRCVALTGDGQKHLVLSVDDLITNDGVRITGLLNTRWKRYLFNQISDTNLAACFMFPVPAFNEIWFLYPEAGFDRPNRGLIWNYTNPEGAFTEVVIPDGIVAAAIGDLEGETGDTWDVLTNRWDETDEPWNITSRRKVVLCDQTNTKFYQLDGSDKRDTVSFTGTLQREALPLYDVSESGEPICDFTKVKMFTRLWPKIEGGPVTFRVGYQETLTGPVQWSESESFDPLTDVYVDLGPVTGRAVSIEITSQNQWLLHGYHVDVFPAGEYP